MTNSRGAAANAVDNEVTDRESVCAEPRRAVITRAVPVLNFTTRSPREAAQAGRSVRLWFRLGCRMRRCTSTLMRTMRHVRMVAATTTATSRT